MKTIDCKRGNVVKNKVSGELYYVGEKRALYKIEEIPEEPPVLGDKPDVVLTEDNAILYTRISFLGEREGLYRISDGNLIYNSDFPVNMGNIQAKEILSQTGYQVSFIGEMNDVLGVYSYNISRDEFNLERELENISGEYVVQNEFVAYPVSIENPEYDPEDPASVKEFYSVSIIDTSKNRIYSIDTDKDENFTFVATQRNLVGIAIVQAGSTLYLINNIEYGATPLFEADDPVVYDSVFNHSLVISTPKNVVKISYKTGTCHYIIKDNTQAASVKEAKYIDSYWEDDVRKYAFLNENGAIVVVSVEETDDRGTIVKVA